MKTLRSVLGIVLGCLVWVAAAQTLAGFLAATIAGRRRLFHAGIVVGLFALVRLASLARGSEVGPIWYPIVVLGVGSVAILFGGHLATLIRLSK